MTDVGGEVGPRKLVVHREFGDHVRRGEDELVPLVRARGHEATT